MVAEQDRSLPWSELFLTAGIDESSPIQWEPTLRFSRTNVPGPPREISRLTGS
jgi:hypothetical protein